ncbi:FG-GAP repeat domain-containing protein [Frigidibacter sp. MR17.24]|uniref:FG-GAP repeat domain-containing protein n=1 Tax=Frigidibacter sp. MR17.24 TaxID=3127345 RepID=UPI0030130338
MARRAIAAIGAALLLAAPALAGPRILEAAYDDATTRYPHGALGDDEEWGTLRLTTEAGETRFELPARMVFEDLAPRLADLDGDGAPEVITVESDRDRGARLAVWGAAGRIAATEFLGRRYRWLAPVGAVDLDGDGRVELAYVETPHLRYRLKLVRLEAGVLVPVAEIEGVTNHRFGDSFLQGGITACPMPVLRLADPTWGLVRLVAWSGTGEGAGLAMADLGPYRGPGSLDPARGCRP